jgi:GTP-binding protein
MGDFYFLDLPGYGYAKAGKAQRHEFGVLIARTLDRGRLAGVLWLLDIRRDPSPEDRAVQDLFAAQGTRVLAAVTKGDKLPGTRRAGRERELRETLALDAEQVIMTSARTREGIADLRAAIDALVRDAVV